MHHLKDRLGPDLPSQVQAVRELLFEPLGMGFWIYRRTREQPNALEMSGFQGQYVVILPAHELVIVRLGATNRQSAGFNELVNDLIAVVKAATPLALALKALAALPLATSVASHPMDWLPIS